MLKLSWTVTCAISAAIGLAFVVPLETCVVTADETLLSGVYNSIDRASTEAIISSRNLPLQLIDGERIAFVGNSLAERMNLFGYFEASLHSRFPGKHLVVRNFGRPADEVTIRQRPAEYEKLGDPLAEFDPDTFMCFFGWNESFAGPSGVDVFKTNYGRFLDDYTQKYARSDGRAKPRFVLVSPIAFEPTGDSFLPDDKERNANVQLYSAAVDEVAAKHHIAFVDIFTPTKSLFTAQPGMQFTINGCHVNDAGDRAVATLLDSKLFGGPNPVVPSEIAFERLRAAANDKSWVHLQDYRMLNGWYVYGSRRTWDTETFPRELSKLRQMAAVRDRHVWSIAQGKDVPAHPDDTRTEDLYTPQTRFGDPLQKHSEAETLRYLSPDEFIKSCVVPSGFAVTLFADETMFPEVAKPVQLNFDNHGRLWVATMPTYPQWRPGDPKPNDKLVILEDTDSDGRADKSTVFYDKLHCPTGFEFFNGGVLVVDQPRLIWLKDTDGDDHADLVVHVLDGWATDDTHHTIGAFEWNHGGLLHMLEGVAMSTAVETPWGAFRNYATSGAYVLDPRTWQIQHFVTSGYGNPWCYVFDEWGQGIVGDGTTAAQHWDTPLSGAQFANRQGLNPIFDNEGMRPAIGSEFLISRNFPDDVQRQFVYACVINMNGMPRFEIHDDGAGYTGNRQKANGHPLDLIRSSDKHFRPVDPQIGPDGALWFGDWANALIGHMQYSQRDPNRDHQHGRIYRLSYQGKPLVPPVTQCAKSITELFDQFYEYEWRTRERARRELCDRPVDEVKVGLAEWIGRLDPAAMDFERLLCEALWIQQGHHIVDPALLNQLLRASAFQARAAATRVVADERLRIPDAFSLLKVMIKDEHPRVRTEALRGLSHYSTPESVDAMLVAACQPLDYWTRYTLEQALSANESAWRQSFLTGKLAIDNPSVQDLLSRLIMISKTGGAAVPYLRILLGQTEKSLEERDKAIQSLANMSGNQENGHQVFRRTCMSCHKIGPEGATFGPELTKVGSKLSRHKLVQSIIEPNADVDPKYLSMAIVKDDGQIVTGLMVSETPDEVALFDGKEKRTVRTLEITERHTLKQSSMPDGLAATLAPAELLDLIEYLAGLK